MDTLLVIIGLVLMITGLSIILYFFLKKKKNIYLVSILLIISSLFFLLKYMEKTTTIECYKANYPYKQVVNYELRDSGYVVRDTIYEQELRNWVS